MNDEPRDYDEAVQMVHRAFCDPDHELVGEWDRSMADALRRNGYEIRALTPEPPRERDGLPRYAAREIENTSGPMWEVVEQGNEHESYCISGSEACERIAAALNAAARSVTPLEGLREAREVVRKRLHNTCDYRDKGDHERDLNAICNSMARWIVDDVVATIATPASPETSRESYCGSCGKRGHYAGDRTHSCTGPDERPATPTETPEESEG